MNASAFPVTNDNSLGFYFVVPIAGADVAFQEVSGIPDTLQNREIFSGGNGRFKHDVPSSSTYNNLVLKRAITSPESYIVKWCTGCISSWHVKIHDGKLSLLDSNGTVYKAWIFHEAYPIRYAASGMHSREKEIVIESIELAYTFFSLLPANSDMV